MKTFDQCNVKKPSLTVVMIHGIASDSAAAFTDALNYFKQTHELDSIRFVTFDLLGSGKSLKSNDLKYDYKEQITALHNSIKRLKLKTPLIPLGHSLGTFIVTKYANTYPKEVSELILVSPPIYTKKDMRNPAFAIGMDMFKKAVSVRNPSILQEKAFASSMNNIVLNPDNYDGLVSLKVPTVMVYGNEDQLIASYNIPKLLKVNSNIVAHKTHGRHSVTQDKYIKIAKILEETNAKDL